MVSLFQMYGRLPGYRLDALTEAQRRRKMDCCRDLLQVLDVIDPGISRLRGEQQQQGEEGRERKKRGW